MWFKIQKFLYNIIVNEWPEILVFMMITGLMLVSLYSESNL
jgi:hypothetical protein